MGVARDVVSASAARLRGERLGFQEIKQRETQNIFSLLFKWFAASIRNRTTSAGSRSDTPVSFAAHLVQPTQAEAPKTASLFDLSEDWFHDCLPHFVKHRPASVRSLCRIACLIVVSFGGGPVAGAGVASCLSLPLAIYRSNVRHAFIRSVAFAPVTPVSTYVGISIQLMRESAPELRGQP